MSDTPRTDAATRMAFSCEHMVEIEEAQKLERDLAQSKEANAGLMRACDNLERELAEVNEKLRQHVSILKSSDAHNNDMFCKLEKERELHSETKSELADMRESELRFSKCFERIARAVGITSPLVLMAMAESDEENYAEILARHIENRESKKAKEVSHE